MQQSVGVTDRRPHMNGYPHEQKERLQRIQLIGRVQLAYEQLKDTMQRYREDSPRARAAIAAAKRRLALLNRALAIIALEAAPQASRTTCRLRRRRLPRR